MTISTDKGKTYECEYAYAPTRNGECVIQLPDNRPLSEIAAEFEGVKSFHVDDPDTGSFEYSGYTQIARMARNGHGVNIILIQGKEQAAEE